MKSIEQVRREFVCPKCVEEKISHHFKRDVVDSTSSNWIREAKYWGLEEPLACLYQSTKIKL